MGEQRRRNSTNNVQQNVLSTRVCYLSVQISRLNNKATERASLFSFAGVLVSKSLGVHFFAYEPFPRGNYLPSSNAFSSYFSRSISPRVRTPKRRNKGRGGHHPCRLCCSRNDSTTPGNTSHFLSRVTPSKRPVKASVEALASSARSMSHSWSSSSMRLLMTPSLLLAYRRMLLYVW